MACWGGRVNLWKRKNVLLKKQQARGMDALSCSHSGAMFVGKPDFDTDEVILVCATRVEGTTRPPQRLFAIREGHHLLRVKPYSGWTFEEKEGGIVHVRRQVTAVRGFAFRAGVLDIQTPSGSIRRAEVVVFQTTSALTRMKKERVAGHASAGAGM